MTDSSRAIFLSYASEDAPAAQRIAEALESAGIEVWFDRSELRGGDAWDEMIRRQIRECVLFVPVISANTVVRHEGYFRLEWSLADQRTGMIARNRAFILPIVIDDTPESTPDVPDSFQRVQWTRLSPQASESAFASRVAALLARERPTQTAHTSPAMSGGRSGSPGRRRRWLIPTLTGCAALALIVGLYAWRTDAIQSIPSSSPIPEKSVAVMPFVDLSEHHDQEYFSDGLAEELLNVLSQVDGLRVPSRTSSFSFKGKSDDLSQIASRLRVSHVLEGSVRKSGSTIRVTAQLIRASDGYHVWSKTFDREFRDVFKIQDDIAKAVAESLRATLGATASTTRGTTSPEAYALLLQANYWSQHTNPENLRKAVEFAKKALAIDPNYSDAWARLGISYGGMAGGDLTRSQAVAMERESAARAIAAAPERSLGHAAMAYNLTNTGDFAAARKEIAFLKQDPARPYSRTNAEGRLESVLGHWQRAIQIYEEGLANDPLNPLLTINLAESYWGAGRLADAEAAFRRHIALVPDGATAHGELALVLMASGRLSEALKTLQLETDPELALVASIGILQRLNRPVDVEAKLEQLHRRFGASEPMVLAEAYALLGRRQEAFAWLENSRRSGDTAIFALKGDPILAPLHGDPRWVRLLTEVNLPE